MNAQTLLDFWFSELTPSQWFVKDAALDALISSRFKVLHHQASCAELFGWRSTPKGRLAEIIVLDQLSRNIYRDTATAFAQDALALGLAQEAVALELDQSLLPIEKNFLYMPYMHSESRKIHQYAVSLFANNGLEQSYQFELKHKKIIDLFGRYPHRNAILGRESTPAELEFLKQPGSGF